MPSNKNWNGLPPVVGTPTKRPSDSAKRIPTLPSLGFYRSANPVTIKKDSHLGIYDSWDKGVQHQKELLYVYVLAKQTNRMWRTLTVLLLLMLASTAMFMVGFSINLHEIQQQQIQRGKS